LLQADENWVENWMTFAHLDDLRMHSGSSWKGQCEWIDEEWFSCYKCTHSLSLYLVLEHCACACKSFGVLEQHGLLMPQQSWCGCCSDLQIFSKRNRGTTKLFLWNRHKIQIPTIDVRTVCWIGSRNQFQMDLELPLHLNKASRWRKRKW
jgi:hypothetical protein